MEWTKEKVRELRLRMGWSQSDLARHLEIEVDLVTKIESGSTVEFDYLGSRLGLYWQQAESLAEEVWAGAMAEQVMSDHNLNQLFYSELQDKYIE